MSPTENTSFGAAEAHSASRAKSRNSNCFFIFIKCFKIISFLISRKREFGNSLFIKNSFSSEHSHPIFHKVTQNFEKSEKSSHRFNKFNKKVNKATKS